MPIDDIFKAIRQGRTEPIGEWFDDPLHLIDERNESGMTALKVAASVGDIEMLRFFLKRGASVLPSAADDSPVVLFAILGGNLECVRTLLDAGAPLAAGLPGSLDLLMLATVEGHEDIVRDLLSRGADVNARSEKGWTCLSMAVAGGWPALLALLAESGADPHVVDADGNTLLHTAVDDSLGQSMKAAFSFLRFTAQDDVGEAMKGLGTIFRTAAKSEDNPNPIGKALMEAAGGFLELLGESFRREELERQGPRPLPEKEPAVAAIEAFARRIHVLERLLGMGVDPSAQNQRSQTALDAAIRQEHPDFVRMLAAAMQPVVVRPTEDIEG